MATMIAQVKGFTRNNKKSGAKGLSLLNKCIDHMFEHNDWTPLAWMIAQSEGADSTRLRAITNKVVGGVTLKKDKDQPSGMRIVMGDNAGPTDKMQTLRDLVKDDTSFRSNKVKVSLFDAVVNPFDVNKYAQTISNKLAKEDVSVADLMKAMAAIK